MTLISNYPQSLNNNGSSVQAAPNSPNDHVGDDFQKMIRQEVGGQDSNDVEINTPQEITLRNLERRDRSAHQSVSEERSGEFDVAHKNTLNGIDLQDVASLQGSLTPKPHVNDELPSQVHVARQTSEKAIELYDARHFATGKLSYVDQMDRAQNQGVNNALGQDVTAAFNIDKSKMPAVAGGHASNLHAQSITESIKLGVLQSRRISSASSVSRSLAYSPLPVFKILPENIEKRKVTLIYSDSGETLYIRDYFSTSSATSQKQSDLLNSKTHTNIVINGGSAIRSK